MSYKKKLALLLVALVATLGLSACGGSDSGEDTVSGTFEVLPAAPAGYDNLSGEAKLTRADGGTTTTIDLSGLEPDTEYMAHLHTGGCDGAEPGGPHFKFNPSGSEEPPNEIHLSFKSNGDGSDKAEASSDKEVPLGEAGSVVLHLADGHEQMAALFVHGGEDHGDDQAGDDHGDQSHHGDESQQGEAEPDQEQSDKIACAELEGASAEAAVPTIEVRNGEPVGGIQELEFSAGEEIRFKVEGDEAEEIHVHGYDLMKDIPAGGGSVEFAFPAEIEGIFEAELEGQGVQIAELRVNP
ncbi:MAG: hypothetical protein JJE35_11240 [Thermoleophilia bacterium]|nr:hypothetical protein [Thermoleophilia bacterium]